MESFCTSGDDLLDGILPTGLDGVQGDQRHAHAKTVDDDSLI